VRGLSSQPDIAIVSNSLDFPIPDVLTKNGRRVVVFTSGEPDGGRVAEIEENAGIVVNAGKNGVNGKKMVETLAELGYQTIYSGAGPKILHLLLTSQVLNRLYLTQVPRLLGGDPFSSIVEGNLFNPAPNLKLNTIYHDPTGVDGLGQLFLSYDIDKSVR
jgi:riboflavin biosynthesis pyrimidine reductase